MNGSFDRVVSIRRLCEKLRIAPPSRPLNLKSLSLANAFGAFGSVQQTRDLLVATHGRAVVAKPMIGIGASSTSGASAAI